MRILVKAGEMRFHHLQVHPRVSSCTCFFPCFDGTVRVLLLIQRNAEHNRSWFRNWNDARLLWTLPKRLLWKFLLAACVSIQVKAAADSGSRKSTRYKNRYHCWNVQTGSVSQQLLDLFPSEWRTACDTCFYFLTKQASQFTCVEPPPRRHGDADVFLLWLLHTSHLNVPTPLNDTSLERPETNLKPGHSLKPLSLNYAAGPDIFTLTPVFWRFPLAFEHSSVFLLSLITAAKPTACSLDSASNIYVQRERPEQPDCERHVEAAHHRWGFGTKREIDDANLCPRSIALPLFFSTVLHACSCI